MFVFVRMCESIAGIDKFISQFVFYTCNLMKSLVYFVIFLLLVFLESVNHCAY